MTKDFIMLNKIYSDKKYFRFEILIIKILK